MRSYRPGSGVFSYADQYCADRDAFQALGWFMVKIQTNICSGAETRLRCEGVGTQEKAKSCLSARRPQGGPRGGDTWQRVCPWHRGALHLPQREEETQQGSTTEN